MENLDKRKKKVLNKYQKAKDFFDKNYREKYAKYKNAYDANIKRDTIAAWRSNICIPLGFTIVQTELPRAMEGIFNDGNFWNMTPIDVKDRTLEVQKEAYNTILQKQREDAHWMSNLRAATEDAIKLGAGWVRVTWKTEELNSEYFDEVEGKVQTIKQTQKTIDGNFIKRLDPNKVYPDPDADSYWDCKYICEDLTICVDELKDNAKKYNEKGEYASLMDSISKLGEIEVLDAFRLYEKNQTTLVVNGYMIHQSPNSYKHSQLPILPIIKYPDAGNVRGKGVIEIIYDMILYLNKTYNLKADNLMLSILKIFLKKKTANLKANALDLYPGKVSEVEDPNTDIKVLDMGVVNPQVFTELRDLNGYVNQAVGNLDYINSPTGIGDQNKTARGAELIVSEANIRFAEFIKYNKENFIIPLTRMLVENIQQMLTDAEAKKLLTEQQVKDLGLEDKGVNMNLKFKYLANGASSTDTKAMRLQKVLQVLPMLQNMPEALARLDFNELVNYIKDSMDLPEALFKKVEKPADAQAPEGGAADKAKKDKIMAIIQTISQKYNVDPKLIVEKLKAGQSPEQIVEELEKGGTPGGQVPMQQPLPPLTPNQQ